MLKCNAVPCFWNLSLGGKFCWGFIRAAVCLSEFINMRRESQEEELLHLAWGEVRWWIVSLCVAVFLFPLLISLLSWRLAGPVCEALTEWFERSPFIAAPISANAEMLMLGVRSITFQTAAFPCREHNTVTDYLHLSLNTRAFAPHKGFLKYSLMRELVQSPTPSLSDHSLSWKASQKYSALQRWCYELRIREWYGYSGTLGGLLRQSHGNMVMSPSTPKKKKKSIFLGLKKKKHFYDY